MTGITDGRRVTRVDVDHSTLKREVSGADLRFSVNLIGPVDRVWAEAYRILQADSTAFRRLRLDETSRTVSFTCRIVEGPAQVFDVLERLDALIRRVNLQVSGGR